MMIEYDLTLISYFITAIAIAYNLILFTAWLFITKHEGGGVSCVYKIVMALFFVRLYGVCLGINARLLREGVQPSDYYNFTSGVLWHSRIIPEALIFIVLAFVMTNRFVKSYLFDDPEYRARNGNRKTD